MLQDIRYAARSLLRTPSFTVIAVLTLALGIGANTTIFSVLYDALLRPLPYPAQDRLAGVQQTVRGDAGYLAVTYREFRYLAEHARMFEGLAASTEVGFNLASGEGAARVSGLHVSHNYFQVLGVEPAIGRGFTADEDQESGPLAVVLSDAVWRQQFAADVSLLGRTITLDGRPFTVVGVMPAGFRSQPDAQVWTTLAQVSRSIGGGENLGLVGRLKPGVTWDAARAEFEALNAGWRAEFKNNEAVLGIAVAPLREVVAQGDAGPVRVLFGAVALVLLIACANVANLMLGRGASRSREIAVRVAVGASRGRIIRQVLTESLLLALAGGLFGLLVAEWSLGGLVRLLPPGSNVGPDPHLDAVALGFTFVTAALTGLLFGLVPAWQVSRADLQATLKDGGGRTTGSASHHRLRRALVVGELAVSVVLLIGSGLLIRTFANLMREDGGFDPRPVLSAEIWLTGSQYDSTAKIAGFYHDLETRLRAIPGVRSAAVVEAGMPLERGGNMGVQVDGEWIKAQTNYRTITPAYFSTLSVPLKRGRAFSDADGGGAPQVAVVSELFARRHMGGLDRAIGRTVHVGGPSGPTAQVVGIVGDVRQFIGERPFPTVYIPSAQTPASFTRVFSGWFPIHVLVQTAGDPALMQPLIERTLRTADARVPVGRVRPMRDVLAQSLAFQRFLMTLLGAFAGLALVLAAIGTYGVISYLVTQRTHEIGVRMAIGARAVDVMRAVLGQGLALAAAGALLGLGGAVALTRLMSGLLYGVAPANVPTYAVVTLMLVLIALLACWLPARRAAKIDPLVALRSE